MLVINAGGNTNFNLFASKTSNTADVIMSVKAAGTLRMGESRSYKLDSDNMQMKSENGGFQNTIRAPDFDLALLITLWGVTIAAILILLRRRARRHVEA